MTTTLPTREATTRTPRPTPAATTDRTDATPAPDFAMIAARIFGFSIVIGSIAAAMGAWLLTLM